MTSSQNTKASIVIVLNSLVYFLLAYFFVITISNVFSILMGKISGFNGILYYYGFEFLEDNTRWAKGNIFLIFGLGIGITFFMGVAFERWYKKIRRQYIKAKLFILWVCIISFTWFFGNIVVGAFLNFGLGAAMRAFSIPFFMRIVAAIVASTALVGLGYYFKIHVFISSNMYYRQLPHSKLDSFFFKQIIIPALLGILIVMLFKYPHSSKYQYMDILCLLPFIFIGFGGLIERSVFPSLRKSRKYDTFKINFQSLFFLLILLAAYRFGLADGLHF
ncbi:MAG: hypothetical protein U9R19_05770 [Bacteroidota bacterium]|nr:hypothetical protein [Bacteroidota bacterium]